MSDQQGYIPQQLQNDVDESVEFDVNDLDEKLYVALQRCNSAVCVPHMEANYREIKSDLLLGMIDTHKALRLLLTKVDNSTGLAAHACTLARAQVETLFVDVWLAESVLNHVAIYRKDAWVKLFRRAVLHEIESENIPRLAGFYEAEGGKLLETWARAVGISEPELNETRQFIEKGMVGERPPLLKREVPTPKAILDDLRGSEFKDVLDRLYHIEYRYLCGFPHPSQCSDFLRRSLRQSKDQTDAAKWERYIEHHLLDPSYHNSALSILCVATKC